jgi:hypothetical protein
MTLCSLLVINISWLEDGRTSFCDYQTPHGEVQRAIGCKMCGPFVPRPAKQIVRYLCGIAKLASGNLLSLLLVCEGNPSVCHRHTLNLTGTAALRSESTLCPTLLNTGHVLLLLLLVMRCGKGGGWSWWGGVGDFLRRRRRPRRPPPLVVEQAGQLSFLSFSNLNSQTSCCLERNSRAPTEVQCSTCDC